MTNPGWKQARVEEYLRHTNNLPNGWYFKVRFYDSAEYYFRLHNLIRLRYRMIEGYPHPFPKAIGTIQVQLEAYLKN